MCLETLKGVKEIGGFEIAHMNIATGVSSISIKPVIYINDDTNTIAFQLQNGPIKEVGVNGCQVDTLIEAAKMIIEGLDKNFPCDENYFVITKLDEALAWLSIRKKNREKRGVEGFNKE